MPSSADKNDLWAQMNLDVVARLEDILETMKEATDLEVAWSTGNTDSCAELRQLQIDLASVRRLELRMPVVAPMKSGKSTLINAIVGYNLLPARAEAMTTLPTKIILQEGLDEPELTIAPTDVDALSWLAQNVAIQPEYGQL